LLLAANNGHTDVVKVLLAKGADLKAKDELGETALMCAERCGHMDIARILKDAGARE
jgi:ankyrin repeat protein